MSSLALQLFVNLNKLLAQYSEAGLGSGYAKQLVDQVKTRHPELLACNDPSNAHTSALTAFAVGLGLHDLRHNNGSEFTQLTLGQMLKDALDRADEQLERLGESEIHLVLQAHEEYKTYIGARSDLVSCGHALGQARGVDDILPRATTSIPFGNDYSSWQIGRPVAKQISALQASRIDIGEIDLPDIAPATTGAVSFQTSNTGPTLESREPQTTAPELSDLTEQSSEHDFPLKEDTVAACEARINLDTPHPSDRHAEREMMEDGELRGESVDEMPARQRRQVGLRGYGPGQRADAIEVARKRSVLEETQWSEPTDSTGETFLHSESAPNSGGKRKPQRKPISPVIWAAPTFVLLPPVGLFYSGVLWGRGAWGGSLATLGLSIAGAGGLIAWMLLG